MAVGVETYFRRPDGVFVPFSAAPVRPPEASGDLEGSVEVVVDGTAVLTKDTWDAVDLLWVFLCQLASDFAATGDATTSYPDQPLPIRLRRIRRPGWVLLSRGATDHDPPVSATAAERELLAALVAGAEAFFAHLENVVPACPSYGEALRMIRTAAGHSA